MSEIIILHLSDIHFKKKKNEESNTFRADVQRKMIETINLHAKTHGFPHFVAVTGDIAFSGKEYDEAAVFFSELKKVLNGKTQFLMVPGNHDIDREEVSPFFSLHAIINDREKIDRLLETPKEIDKHIQGKFQAYREFVEQIHPGLYNDKDRYFWTKDFAHHDVSFIGLNSSWACENDLDRNNITLGYPQISKAINRPSIANRIALLHHPFNWLKEEDFNRYSGDIFKNCRLILHGHSHSDNAQVLTNPAYSCIYLGANASYAQDNENFIGFQFIEANFSTHGLAVKVWPYRLEERNGLRFVPDTHRWEGQDGPFFELSTSAVSSKEIKEIKEASLPLKIPAAYKEWIKEFHSTMDIDLLARKGEAVLIRLPEVYIPLEVANPFYKSMDGKLNEQENDEETPGGSAIIDIEELLEKWQCLLLRGNAGTGKTTVIKHLAYSLSQGTGPVHLQDCLPVIIMFKDLWPIYKNALRDGLENITFESLLPGYFKKIRCPLTIEIIDAYLAQGRAFFLLDGLDEILGENRTDLVNLLHQFQHAYRSNRFLITGRPHGIEGQAEHCFGQYIRNIEALGEKKVETFITRWFRAVSGQARGQADMTAADMISEIRLHEHAGLFTGNPLLLTALCVFYLVGGKRIPDQRADLYDRIVANLLYRRFHDPADTEKENKVREYLMDLAFHMQTRNLKNIETYDAKELLKEHNPIFGNEPVSDYKRRIGDLFNGIEPVCGLLNRPSSGEIEFAHLSFQEFLAAKHMLDRDMNYKPYLESGWWKETLLLYLGLMNLEMKKRSNDIVCELIKKYPQPGIPLLGAKALRDFQPSKREENAVALAREKLLTIIESRAPLAERFEAGEILGQLGDPRIDGLNPPMVPVPAGKFTRGSNELEREKPVRLIELDGFSIGKYPVTNREFRAFIIDKGYETKDYWTSEGWHWLQKENITEPGYRHNRKWNGHNFPVVGVSWYEASAYADWLSKKTGQRYCLPTEAQWEKAARGSRGFQYPWGDTFDKNKCNSNESGLNQTSPVGMFPAGKSPYECLDMAGNVWEWCSDWYEDNYYKESPGRNPQGPDCGSVRVLRGGSWIGGAGYCRAAYRLGIHPAFRGGYVGFRLLRSL